MHRKDHVGVHSKNPYTNGPHGVLDMFVLCFFIYPWFCFQWSCLRVVFIFIGSYAADWCEFAVVVIDKHCQCEVPGQPTLVRKNVYEDVPLEI